MGYEWAHYGSVRLKPGTALQQVLDLFPRGDEAEPQLPLDTEGELTLADGDVWIKLEAEVLEYRADGHSGSLDDQVCGFIEALAETLAAEGWIDYEIGDYEVVHGPTELARAQAKLESARSAFESAQTALAKAEAEMRRAASP